MGERSVTLLIMATLLEAKPFVSGLGLSLFCEKPFQVFKNDRQVLVISGIGKTHAAAAVCYGCLTFSPQTVVNAGAAGALDKAHPVGAIYQVKRIVEHDRPDLFSGKPVSHEPDMITAIPTATLTTGDCPVLDPAERSRLGELAELVDMEAAAVVQTCRTMSVPCIVLKFVSDNPDHTNGMDIVNNIRQFRSALFDFYAQKALPELGM